MERPRLQRAHFAAAGEEQARSLGVPVEALRLGTLVRVSLVSGHRPVVRGHHWFH